MSINLQTQDVLSGKSDDEIRRAATFWFMCAESFQRGEPVPQGVFLLSTQVGLTDDDIAWVRRIVAENPELAADPS